MYSRLLFERIRRAQNHRFKNQQQFVNSIIRNRLRKSDLSLESRKSPTRSINITMKRVDLEFALRCFIQPNLAHIKSKPSSYVYQIELDNLATCMESFNAENIFQDCSLGDTTSFVCPKGRVVAVSNSFDYPQYHQCKLFNNHETQYFGLLDTRIDQGILILDKSFDGRYILCLGPGSDQHDILGHSVMGKIGWVKKADVAIYQSVYIRLSCNTSELKLNLPRCHIDSSGHIKGTITPSFSVPQPPPIDDAIPPPPPLDRETIPVNSSRESCGFLSVRRKRSFADILRKLRH